MNDELEELIREIATKHGIAVARDDPILVLQTINNRLMQDSSKAQQVLLDHYKEELEALALRWGDDAKGKAERILNPALAVGKDAMQGIMEESARTVARSVMTEVDEGLARVQVAVRESHKIAMLNVISACVTMAAAATALWAVVR